MNFPRPYKFPQFWPLQLVGWLGMYVMILFATLPVAGAPGIVRGNAIYVAIVFLESCLLRLLCRAAFHKQMSWMALELRAFFWSTCAGVVASPLIELGIADLRPIEWINLLTNWLQVTVMLFLWCSLYFSIKHWRQSYEERERLILAEAELRQVRLNSLRYQLNPHFLFNALNAVSTLVAEGNAVDANRMLSQIAELLRSTLGVDDSDGHTLRDEIALVNRYLDIEKVRFGDRLEVTIDFDETVADALVPAMLLQPLVENAIKHGINLQLAGGWLCIAAQPAGEQLVIEVENSGQTGPATLSLDSVHSTSPGVGLANTRERLRTLYPDRHRLDLQWPEHGGCKVVITIPLVRKPVAPCAS
jgi:two-component system LytT family sensor kinase